MHWDLYTHARGMVERTLPPRGMLALVFEMISFSWKVLSFPFETQVAFRREAQVEPAKEIGETCGSDGGSCP